MKMTTTRKRWLSRLTPSEFLFGCLFLNRPTQQCSYCFEYVLCKKSFFHHNLTCLLPKTMCDSRAPLAVWMAWYGWLGMDGLVWMAWYGWLGMDGLVWMAWYGMDVK